MKVRKNIALVAHDNRKKDLIEWVEWNVHVLVEHTLTCTGTTGTLIERAIVNRCDRCQAIARQSVNAGPLSL